MHSHVCVLRAWARCSMFTLAIASSVTCSDGGHPAGVAGGAGEAGDDGSGVSGNGGGSAGTDHGVPGAAPGSWAYLVYMLADNNLEAFTTADLEEMMQVGSSDQLTILVQLDRAEGESTDAVGGLAEFSGVKRLRVKQGTLTVLEDLGELNSGARDTFQDFLRWGVEAAPADHYAVVLWDHGGAWAQFGADASSGNDG